MTADFDALFAATRQTVYAVCRRITQDRQEAEDATQQTFLEVYRALPQFRGESQVQTWVVRIAIRLAIKANAKRNRAAALEDAPERAVHAEDALVAKLDSDRVAQAMAWLPVEHRTVLALFAAEGLSHPQIADVLGVAEGTVWSRLHAARKRLKAELGDPG